MNFSNRNFSNKKISFNSLPGNGLRRGIDSNPAKPQSQYTLVLIMGIDDREVFLNINNIHVAFIPMTCLIYASIRSAVVLSTIE